MWRAEPGEGMLSPGDPHIVAVATDAKMETKLPVLDLNAPAAVAKFVLRHLKLA